MFYRLQSPIEIILLIISLVVFAVLAWRRLDWGAASVLFLAPVYLLKIKIGWLSLNILEVLIWLLAFVWLIKNIEKLKSSRHQFFGSLLSKKIVGPVLLILVGVVLSIIFSADLKVGAGIFKSYFLAPLVFVWVLRDIVKTKGQFIKIIWAIVLSGVTVAMIGIIYRLAGYLTFDGRLAAFYSSPNQLAMFLAPGFLFSVFLWLPDRINPSLSGAHASPYFCSPRLGSAHKNAALRSGHILSGIIFIICLYFTYSYAAWLAIFGAMVFFLVSWRGNFVDYKKLFFVFCLFSVVLAVLFFSQWQSQKVANLLKFDRSSIQSRLMIWSSVKEILKDNWLFGIGPGLFQQKYLEYQKLFVVPYLEWAAPQPHNLFLAWWLQVGLVGLIGFFWLLIGFFKNTWLSWLKTKQPLILCLMAVMIYFLLHGLIDTTFWRNDLALIWWTVIALADKASRLFC